MRVASGKELRTFQNNFFGPWQINEDGTAGPQEDFAAGWLTENGEYLGRPVDIAQLADGSLLVSDDLAGAIYRIWHE